MKTPRDRLIALAGLYQAVGLVDRIGRDGQAEPEALRASLFSLTQIDAENVAAVFGGPAGIALGLETLRRELLVGTPRNLYLSHYALQVIHLEAKLRRSRERLDAIRAGIEQVQQGLQNFALDHPNSIARCAEIYSNNISTLQPRIMVKGEALHLQNPDNANRIRALLLAAIRACLLWRQCGGRRWQIILGRNSLLRQIDRLRAEIPERE